MSFGDSDLHVFTADMGERATFNGVTVNGIFNESDEIQPTAESTFNADGHVTTLYILATDWPDVGDESEITVSGRTWIVEGDARKADDGKFKILDLVEVTP